MISDSFVDGPSYTIYSISYNEKNGSFDKVKEIYQQALRIKSLEKTDEYKDFDYR